jgi:hypothetical protein
MRQNETKQGEREGSGVPQRRAIVEAKLLEALRRGDDNHIRVERIDSKCADRVLLFVNCERVTEKERPRSKSKYLKGFEKKKNEPLIHFKGLVETSNTTGSVNHALKVLEQKK